MARCIGGAGNGLLMIGGSLEAVICFGLLLATASTHPTELQSPIVVAPLVLAFAGGVGAILFSGRPLTLTAATVLMWLAVTPILLGKAWGFTAAPMIIGPVLLVTAGAVLKLLAGVRRPGSPSATLP